MKLSQILSAAVALSVLTAAPLWAQDTANAEDTVVEEVTLTEEEAVEAAPATYDVWWGNRSISYGNYIRFDRISVDSMAAAPAAPMGPMVFDTLYFDKDKSVLNPGPRAIVDDAIRLLRANPSMEVLIEVQSTGATMSASQLSLSQRRANAVRQYLVENGIADTRIKVSAAGEARVSGGNTAVLPVSAN